MASKMSAVVMIPGFQGDGLGAQASGSRRRPGARGGAGHPRQFGKSTDPGKDGLGVGGMALHLLPFGGVQLGPVRCCLTPSLPTSWSRVLRFSQRRRSRREAHGFGHQVGVEGHPALWPAV